MSRWPAPSASRRSRRTGWRALAHSLRTRPGVSSPASVVRSIQVMARRYQAACHSFFTVRRLGRVAARRSAALGLTRTSRTQSSSSGVPRLRSEWISAGFGTSDGRLIRSWTAMASAPLRAGSLPPLPQLQEVKLARLPMHQHQCIVADVRTTVTLDDDVYEAAQAHAQATGKRLGRVLSEMAPQAV